MAGINAATLRQKIMVKWEVRLEKCTVLFNLRQQEKIIACCLNSFFPPPSFIVIRLVELIAVLALFEEQSLQDLHCRKEHQPTPPSGPN